MKTGKQMLAKLRERISKAKTNPALAWALLKTRLRVGPGGNREAADPAHRSISDDGRYTVFCERAARSARTFRSFRRHPDYVPILEHVTFELVQAYLDVLHRWTPQVIKQIDDFKVNDLVGEPITHSYAGIGRISPTTLRYLKVATDLETCFNWTKNTSVAEIGVGYGGQLLCADRLLPFGSWTLFDLPPVLRLASRYLESHLLRGSYRTTTLNQSQPATFDIVISNYAFSELPAALQLAYMRKIVSQSGAGYITMNSGREGTPFNSGHISLEDVRRHLPQCVVIDEYPQSCPGCYIVLCGNKAQPTWV